MHFSELAQTVDPAGVQRVLLIPFEDQELPQLIQRFYPQAVLTVFRKHDLAGLSALNLIRRVRAERWDIAIASIHTSAVRRTQISVELLLGHSTARERFVRTNSDSLIHVTTRRLTFVLAPQLLLGSLVGLCVVFWTYLYVMLLARKTPYPVHPQTVRSRNRQKTVLFLRTDLAGSVLAGGSVTHAKGMVKAFLRAGFRVIYVADAPLDVLPGEVTQIQIKPMALLDFFDELQFLQYNLRVILKLGPLMRRYAPTLIYQRHAICSFAGGAVARQFGVPLVLEANDSEVWIKRHWSRLLLDDLATRCEAIALRLADRITVISSGVQEQLRQYSIESTRYLLNPNGVDPDEFHPDIDGTPIRQKYGLSNKVVVGFIGTFTRWHGIETLVEAAVQIARQKRSICFLLVGDGDLRSALQKRCADLGFQRRIIFTGLIPHSDAPQHLAACDILVSPHLGFQDGTKFFGSPTKLFEYMAMGKPIIASRLEQIGEVIVDGLNGLQMEPGDVQGLVALITKLARDKNLRLKLGTQARKDVIRRYTWDANVGRIVKSFENTGS